MVMQWLIVVSDVDVRMLLFFVNVDLQVFV